MIVSPKKSGLSDLSKVGGSSCKEALGARGVSAYCINRSSLQMPQAPLHMKAPRQRGQATVELFLLLPILIFLLGIIIHAFRVNHTASEQSIGAHVDALKTFDHGLGKLKIDGVEIPPGEIINLIPPSAIDLGDLLSQIGSQVGLDIGLNALFSKIGFLNSDKFVAGAIKSGVTSAAHSFVESGFKDVNWESAAWAAATGGFSSGQASEWFQGQNLTQASGREAFGSMAQGAVTGFTGSEGDWKGAVQGGVGGLFGSDSFKAMENGNGGIAWGAAKGAVQSTVTGALDGKIDSKAILTSAVGGAVGSGQAARIVTMGTYKGDPRNSAIYQGFNGGVSTLLRGGSAKEAAFSAANGAFYSGQTMGAIQRERGIMKEVAYIGYGSVTSLAQGQDAEAVGIGALQSLALAESSRVPGKMGDVTEFMVKNSSTLGDIKNSLEDASAQAQAAKKLTGEEGENAQDEAQKQQGTAVVQAVAFSLLALSSKGTTP